LDINKDFFTQNVGRVGSWHGFAYPQIAHYTSLVIITAAVYISSLQYKASLAVT